MKVAYIIAIVVIAVLVISVVTKAVVVHVLRKKGREKVLETCSLADGNTIFVSLVSIHDAKGAGQTLHSLYKEAQCPLRIYVGLCEIYDDASNSAEPSAVEVYKDLCSHSTTPFCLTDNIRVLRVPLSEARGVLAAREHVERYLYRSETYAATLACSATLTKHWDEYCVAAFKQLNCNNAVLTTKFGVVAPNAAASSVTQAGSYIGVTGTAAVIVNGKRMIVPTLGAFRIKHVPTYRDGSEQDVVVTALPSIAWSSTFSFSLGSRVDEVPFPRQASWESDPFEDVLMTCRLLTAKWKLFCPTGCVGVLTFPAAPQLQNAEEEEQEREPPTLQSELARSVTFEVIKNMGITRGFASARARLGLSRTPNEHELRGKIGSTSEYLSLLARIDLSTSSS